MMKFRIISLRVFPKAKRNHVEKFGDAFKVHLTAAPESGKANRLLVSVLAEHFDIRRSGISIVRGAKSRNKLVKLQPPTP